MCYILTHDNEIINELSQEQKLEYRSIIHEEDTNFVLSSPEDQCTHFETLFYEHKNYILIILQQIIQSQRFKKVSTTLKEVLKNMIKWLNISLHTDLAKYITDQQEHTTNNTRRVTNELMIQGVKTEDIEYYNTHQESILSDQVTESDIYNNYSNASCFN